jgi:hypothetical protein
MQVYSGGHCGISFDGDADLPMNSEGTINEHRDSVFSY